MFLKVGLAPTFCFRLMYRQNQKLINLLEPVVTGLGYELLGIEYLSGGHNALLRLYIDSEAGITVDDCVTVSQQVTGVLDVEDPIRGAYELEVSSPGLDRLLFTLEQIRQHAGSIVSLKLHEKIEGRRRLQGEITSVNENDVSIRVEGTDYLIPAQAIEKARLVPQV